MSSACIGTQNDWEYYSKEIRVPIKILKPSMTLVRQNVIPTQY